MLFRLTNAPATCQELINNVLRVHLDKTVVAYLDNILDKYKSYKELFYNNKTATALLQYKP